MDNSSNPWVATAADCAAGPVTVWTGKAMIENIEFEQYTNATDTATVNQSNGKNFANLKGAADFQTVRTGRVAHADGIVIPQAGITTTGQLKIYHK